MRKEGAAEAAARQAARSARRRSSRAAWVPWPILQVQIPAANADGTTPADIQRVDVYGFTGQPPAREDLFKYGTVVASVPVRKPAEEAPAPQEKGKGKGNEAGKGRGGGRPETWPAPPPRPAPSIQNGFDQGDMVVVTEPIGQAQLADVVIPPKPGVVAAPAPEQPSTPTRFYVAVGVNHKGQKGAVSGRQAVALAQAPPAPSDVAVTHTETALTLVWTPAAGTAAFNVYDVPAGPPAPEGVKIPTPPAAAGQLPVPVNAKPVPGPRLRRFAAGVRHAAVLRRARRQRVRGAGDRERGVARPVRHADRHLPTGGASVAERHRRRGMRSA